MKYFLFLVIPFLTSCICLNPAHKQSGPPIANTNRVINSLENTKNELAEAGNSNTIVGEKIDKALSLAERLQILLQQIEQTESKTVKEPIK